VEWLKEFKPQYCQKKKKKERRKEMLILFATAG
jgi:hypothetical protein